jgi:hypothetical protein
MPCRRQSETFGKEVPRQMATGGLEKRNRSQVGDGKWSSGGATRFLSAS